MLNTIFTIAYQFHLACTDDKILDCRVRLLYTTLCFSLCFFCICVTQENSKCAKVIQWIGLLITPFQYASSLNVLE